MWTGENEETSPCKAQCIFTQHPVLMLSCFICVTLSPWQKQGSISWGLIVCCWVLQASHELLLGEPCGRAGMGVGGSDSRTATSQEGEQQQGTLPQPGQTEDSSALHMK